jgi:hypothetical protein
LTVAEAARLLGLTRNRLGEYIRAGRPPGNLAHRDPKGHPKFWTPTLRGWWNRLAESGIADNASEVDVSPARRDRKARTVTGRG